MLLASPGGGRGSAATCKHGFTMHWHCKTPLEKCKIPSEPTHTAQGTLSLTQKGTKCSIGFIRWYLQQTAGSSGRQALLHRVHQLGVGACCWSLAAWAAERGGAMDAADKPESMASQYMFGLTRRDNVWAAREPTSRPDSRCLPEAQAEAAEVEPTAGGTTQQQAAP